MKTRQALELRARDAIAEVLVELLQVPTIYFDAPWPPTRKRVDVLAIDRAGAGDLHIVLVAKDFNDAIGTLPRITEIPAQFRWVSYVQEDLNSEIERTLSLYQRLRRAPLFSSKGMGRVGVILVGPEEDQHGERLLGEIAIRAERFPGSYYEQVDRFVANHKPDIQFR